MSLADKAAELERLCALPRPVESTMYSAMYSTMYSAPAPSPPRPKPPSPPDRTLPAFLAAHGFDVQETPGVVHGHLVVRASPPGATGRRVSVHTAALVTGGAFAEACVLGEDDELSPERLNCAAEVLRFCEAALSTCEARGWDRCER
jgi:hypothetical protein